MIRAALILVIGAALLGCEGSSSSPSATVNTGSTSANSAKPAAEAPIADSDLAVPADFADEAEKSISQSNYKAELDSLEKEIDSDK